MRHPQMHSIASKQLDVILELKEYPSAAG